MRNRLRQGQIMIANAGAGADAVQLHCVRARSIYEACCRSERTCNGDMRLLLIVGRCQPRQEGCAASFACLFIKHPGQSAPSGSRTASALGSSIKEHNMLIARPGLKQRRTGYAN